MYLVSFAYELSSFTETLKTFHKFHIKDPYYLTLPEETGTIILLLRPFSSYCYNHFTLEEIKA